MEQISQKLKNGVVKVIEVPLPAMNKGSILVQNYYSLISAGTETSTIKTAQKGLLGKAKERPQQVKQVIEVLKQQGPVQTYRAVMKKLDAHSPLGYSSAGRVIKVAEDVTEFRVGDLAACGGLTASHAEVVSVPVNLAVKIPDDTDLKQAAYNTLGSIALQGVRQVDLRLGEVCAVIGLGLLGQLTVLLLKAAGVRTIGIDIDPAMVDIARKSGVDLAAQRDSNGLEDSIKRFTHGIGCDGVIITAASPSLDPINFGGAIARKRGTIVVVGAVPTGFDREPHYYKKELQVRMSCSYGPGRYDPAYEQKGIDYPAAYVRWTEKRNMQAFQELIHSKKMDISHLTTHIYKLEDAPTAFEMILSNAEPFIGILIEYDPQISPITQHKIIVNAQRVGKKPVRSDVNIGFIGAGSYAQSHLLPNIPSNNEINMKGVMTTTGTTSRSVAERFNFEFCTTSETEIVENNDINTVFIASRHDSHAGYILNVLKSGKNVFVEKPLCLTEVELGQIVDSLNSQSADNSPEMESGQTGESLSNNRLSNDNSESINQKGTQLPNQPVHQSSSQPILMVGYNRRFSPLVKKVQKDFGGGPLAMTYRVNAGAIPADSWIQDPVFGGGRILGEVCHFVDTLSFLARSLPVSVYANTMVDPDNLNDTLNISLRYRNGSIGTISYFANGDTSLPKERIEIFASGSTAIIEDFKNLSIYSSGKLKKTKLMAQDKGQKQEVQRFIAAIRNGEGSPIPLVEIYNTSLVTFKIIESILTGSSLTIQS